MSPGPIPAPVAAAPHSDRKRARRQAGRPAVRLRVSRVENDAETEFAEACEQVERIARLRLEARVGRSDATDG